MPKDNRVIEAIRLHGPKMALISGIQQISKHAFIVAWRHGQQENFDIYVDSRHLPSNRDKSSVFVTTAILADHGVHVVVQENMKVVVRNFTEAYQYAKFLLQDKKHKIYDTPQSVNIQLMAMAA